MRRFQSLFLQNKCLISFLRRCMHNVVHSKEKFITATVLKDIEAKWTNLASEHIFQPRATNNKNVIDPEKKYILSMFPYPSGKLHMGHFRIYVTTDAIARFYHMNGFSVIHPMGWDAFGLPAENAAIERGENPEIWTYSNIKSMKAQMKSLGCCFDWSREFATCDPNYYRWTQSIFLRLYKAGLACRRESLVNWDPVDQTVLADEQVDENGYSWRSRAKVEKKIMKQWFINTRRYAKAMLDDLSDPSLQNWRDIIKVQKNWLGECDGYNIELPLHQASKKVSLSHLTAWTKEPELLPQVSFLAINSQHFLNREDLIKVINDGIRVLSITCIEPLSKKAIPVIICDDFEYPNGSDVYIGYFSNDLDRNISNICGFKDHSNSRNVTESDRDEVIDQLKSLNCIYPCSSNLRDWLISRQRYWGTPIPIVHCDSCGTVPVEEENLPIKLPSFKGQIKKGVSILAQTKEWFHCSCPKCGGSAVRETDTMDTFVDSSWYYLRFLDASNPNELINGEFSKSLMPVDLYIGGKEHATLHLYYARFMNKFLQKEGLVFHKEPFVELLVQGVVKAQSFKVENTGRYLKRDEINFSVNPPVELCTDEKLLIKYEKMSKSKHNGVDPLECLDEYGVDVTRMAILSEMSPQSERRWSAESLEFSFKIVKLFWMTVHQYVTSRQEGLPPNRTPLSQEEHAKHEAFLFEKRNDFVGEITSFLSVNKHFHTIIKALQRLLNSLRKIPLQMILSEEYEKTLKALIILVTPICPHLSAEAWSHVTSVSSCPHESSVFNETWPLYDPHYKLNLKFYVDEKLITIYKILQEDCNSLTKESAISIGKELPELLGALGDKKIILSSFGVIPNYQCFIHFYTKPSKALSRKKRLK